MTEELLSELIEARRRREPCAIVTVAATTGSVPRAAGAKMLVFGSGKISGTIGGGKFESLVVQQALDAMFGQVPVLKTFPLHEGADDSFGAICGGEATVLIEPQTTKEALFLVGAGHCARAIAKLARECGLHVTAIDDRDEVLGEFEDAHTKVGDRSPAAFISGRPWREDEALVIVSRHYEIDRDALEAALGQVGIGYLGMIGSERKVRRVFDALLDRGFTRESLARVHAPIGLDIGAESPTEIAVSVVAEALQVLRKRPGRHLRDSSF